MLCHLEIAGSKFGSQASCCEVAILVGQVAVAQRPIQYVEHDFPLPRQVPMTAQLFGGIEVGWSG
jgi:hypothetical protein